MHSDWSYYNPAHWGANTDVSVCVLFWVTLFLETVATYILGAITAGVLGGDVASASLIVCGILIYFKNLVIFTLIFRPRLCGHEQL